MIKQGRRTQEHSLSLELEYQSNQSILSSVQIAPNQEENVLTIRRTTNIKNETKKKNN